MSEHDKLRKAIKWVRGLSAGWDAETINAVCDAAESTLPKTKEVEVWRVEWAYRIETSAGKLEWQPRCGTFLSRESAEREAKNTTSDVACIRVTGPHRQEVPA